MQTLPDNCVDADRSQKLESSASHLWAVLLAGGDGVRLRDLTRRIAGDSRPKQFCRIIGGQSLFRQTCARVAPLFPDDRQVMVLFRAHKKYYGEDLTDGAGSHVIEQPLNRGTGIAIILAVLHVLQRDPDAVVAFFPCDHYCADDDSFRLTIRSALESAGQNPESIILVGADAHYPEVVTISRATTFFEMLRSQAHEAVLAISRAMADHTLDVAYPLLDTLDFSRDVLANLPDRLLVLRDRTSGWADLGSPARVLETLSRNGIQPEWASEEDYVFDPSISHRRISCKHIKTTI